MSDGEQMASDPYAGIFFSKNRVEEIIEPIETEETTIISIPGGSTNEVKILGRGEWMSGCPEGGEQSFLFQLYNTLEEGRMTCSSGCGHSFTRKKQDFFCLFVNFNHISLHSLELMIDIADIPTIHHISQQHHSPYLPSMPPNHLSRMW